MRSGRVVLRCDRCAAAVPPVPQVPGEDEEIDEETMEELQAIIEADYEVIAGAMRDQPCRHLCDHACVATQSRVCKLHSPTHAHPPAHRTCARGGGAASQPARSASLAQRLRPARQRKQTARCVLCRRRPSVAAYTCTHIYCTAAVQVGAVVREKIIPSAVDIFTGEEGMDFGMFPEEEGDEDDGE